MCCNGNLPEPASTRLFTPPATKLVVTVAEAAAMLGVSRSTAYEAVRAGSIPYIKVGRRVLIPIARLMQMVGGEDAPQRKG